MIFIIGLCFYYVLLRMFVYVAFAVFYVMLKLQCFCVLWCLVYNLCWCFRLFFFHVCSIIIFPLILFHWYIYDIVVFSDFYGFNLILMVDCFYVDVLSVFVSVTDVANHQRTIFPMLPSTHSLTTYLSDLVLELCVGWKLLPN